MASTAKTFFAQYRFCLERNHNRLVISTEASSTRYYLHFSVWLFLIELQAFWLLLALSTNHGMILLCARS